MGDETALKEKLRNKKVNTDYRPWLEYRLGVTLFPGKDQWPILD
jgi:hypothetical protein